MEKTLYTIRNYRPTDFDKYLQFNIEVEKLEMTGYCASSQLLRENLYRPNHSPEQDLFIVETVGNIVGYMDITPEVRIGRVILNSLIHPDHRRHGLASKILGHALHRAQELGVRVAHVNIPEDNTIARKALSKLGFRFIRQFLELRLDISRVRWQDSNQCAVKYRTLQRGEEGQLAQLQNRSFTGTWGFNPNTVADIVYNTNLSGFSPEDIVLASEGDKVIGYCWTGITCKGEITPGEGKGRIFMLGVDPDYRGRAIGKRVLLAGLSHLKSKGLQVVELSVDGENKEARALYQSVGFELRTNSLWYEKVIG